MIAGLYQRPIIRQPRAVNLSGFQRFKIVLATWLQSTGKSNSRRQYQYVVPLRWLSTAFLGVAPGTRRRKDANRGGGRFRSPAGVEAGAGFRHKVFFLGIRMPAADTATSSAAVYGFYQQPIHGPALRADRTRYESSHLHLFNAVMFVLGGAAAEWAPFPAPLRARCRRPAPPARPACRYHR